MNKFVIIFFAGLFCSCSLSEKQIKQVNPITALAIRVIGEKNAEHFIFEQITTNSEKDEFEIVSKGEKILVRGNTPVAIASGLNWYLKYYTKSHISWEAKQIIMPKKLPKIDKPIVSKSPFVYSYYLNYCTFNYSMAFWDWERWEKELDWMALNGVNLPLAAVGSEAIWRNTLIRLNFSDKEIKDFIPGPAYNAWWLMGNLEGWGGSVSDAYINQQVDLQKKILFRMSELGMDPVLPGFYGMIPRALKNKFPKADIREQGLWCMAFQRPDFLSPTDSLFPQIAKIYYEELKKLYGEVSFFSGDPFHEGGKTDGINLSKAGINIVYGMKSSFSKSIWVFQGWEGNPKGELLKNIANEDVLILDLDCDNTPQWENRNGWDGKPWIWSMITNYGANEGLFGRIDVIANEPFRALNHSKYPSSLKGIGAMMEGIENNSVIYELLFEAKWHNSAINLDNWLPDYAERRYGQKNENLNNAWQILRKTAYGKTLNKDEVQQGTTESMLCARPALEIPNVSCCGLTKLYYKPEELIRAWAIFISESNKITNNQGFNYDIVNITRQVLSNYALFLHKKIVLAFNENNKTDFKKYSQKFLQILDSQDSLLGSIDQFMVGKWLHDARGRGTNNAEKDLFEYNARTLITTWSIQNTMLHEYSYREWNGMLTDFYKPRWKMFFDYLLQKMNKQNPKEPNFFEFEKAWTKEKKAYPYKALCNPIEASQRVYKIYANQILDCYNKL